jgi:hypothetical protein
VVAVALTTALAFARVFVGHGPTWKLLAVGLTSAGIAVAFERRSLILATLVSAAACAIAVALVVFPASSWFGLPTAHTFHLAVAAAGQIGQEAKIQIAPTQPLAPLMLAGVVAVWAAVFSMHALAVRTGSPLLGLLPPISLLAFADTVLEETVKPQYGIFFLIAGLCLVFSDGLRRVQGWGPVWGPPASVSRGRRWAMGSGARRMGLACVAAAVLAPIVLPGFGSKAVIDLSSSTGNGLDPLVSIRAQLDRTTPLELFRVQSPVAAYWRTVALDSFDGTTWRPEPSQDPVQIQPQISIAAPGLSPSVPIGQRFEQQFTLTHDLGSQWLPAAYPPSAVTSEGSLRYDVSSLSLSADGPLRTGTAYTVTSSVVEPTPDQLDQAVFPHPAQDVRYTELPKDLPASIAGVAEAWTQGQPNDYRKILAIQDHLRSFTYDTKVAPRDDALSMSDFLTVTKRGFCQQFASSMAVMLRTMGIPARVAVGFTPGTFAPGTDTRVVTTSDYHAWVEVLFPTYGWLAFEPTPGRSNPLAAGYSQPAAPCTGPRCGSGGGPGARPGKGVLPDGGPGGQKGSRSGPLSGTGPGSFPAEPRSWVPFAGAGTLAILVALLGIPLWRGMVLRARRRRGGRGVRGHILATYRAFTDRAAALGYPRAPGETILEYLGRVGARLETAQPSLARLTGFAGEAAYGPIEPPVERSREAAAAAHEALEALRKTRTVPQRILGWYRPARA